MSPYSTRPPHPGRHASLRAAARPRPRIAAPSVARRRIVALHGLLLLVGCGATEPDVGDAPIARVWRADVAGGEETTLQLAPGGSAVLVEAVLDVESCLARTGSWSRSGDRLALALQASATTPAEERSYDVQVYPDSLVLVEGGARTSFRPASRVPSCVEYGFGSWTGTLRADVDGVTQDFDDVAVRATIASGGLEITSRFRPCPACEPEAVELLLVRDASPGQLEAGA